MQYEVKRILLILWFKKLIMKKYIIFLAKTNFMLIKSFKI